MLVVACSPHRWKLADRSYAHYRLLQSRNSAAVNSNGMDLMDTSAATTATDLYVILSVLVFSVLIGRG
jgi:hypothetical protein